MIVARLRRELFGIGRRSRSSLAVFFAAAVRSQRLGAVRLKFGLEDEICSFPTCRVSQPGLLLGTNPATVEGVSGWTVLLATVATGILSGLRAFTPLAIVSWLAVWGWMPLAGAPFWFAGTNAFAIGISALAVLELVADKLPKTLARNHWMPLMCRAVTGAIAAGAFAFTAGSQWLPGSIAGIIGSLAGAYSGYFVRRALVKRCRLPDLLVAVAEDCLTIAGVLFVVQKFFQMSPYANATF